MHQPSLEKMHKNAKSMRKCAFWGKMQNQNQNYMEKQCRILKKPCRSIRKNVIFEENEIFQKKCKKNLKMWNTQKMWEIGKPRKKKPHKKCAKKWKNAQKCKKNAAHSPWSFPIINLVCCLNDWAAVHLHRLYNLFPRRMQPVIGAHGGLTSYCNIDKQHFP